MSAMNATPLFGEPLGLSRREVQSFDWHQFIAAAAARDAARLGFINEASAEVEKRIGRPTSGPGAWFIPADLLQRDLTTGTAGALVGTTMPTFAEVFRGSSLVGALPMRTLTGLTSDATVPRMQSVAAAWFTEGGSATDAAPTLGQIALSPKTCSAYVLLSHLFRLQTQGAPGQFVERELARAVGAEVGRALLAGTGSSGEPLTPFSAPGVGTEDGASFTWAKANSLLDGCESVGEPGAVRWVAGSTAASVLRQKERSTGNGFVLDGGQIAGYGCLVSSVAPASQLFCANWNAVLYAQWAGVEIAVAPNGRDSTDYRTGVSAVRVSVMVDFAALAPEALAYTTGELS